MDSNQTAAQSGVSGVATLTTESLLVLKSHRRQRFRMKK